LKKNKKRLKIDDSNEKQSQNEQKLEEEKIENAETDDSQVSLLQIPDEMNAMDPESPIAFAMKRHQALLTQQKVGTQKTDDTFTFGATTDGTDRTFDLTKDGKVLYSPPATEQDELLKKVQAKGADAKDRTETPPLNSTELLNDTNVVCVCKRQGAPRGFDRIRCKRNPTPTPTPIPLPPVIVGIKQCANGTWTSGQDKGTNDVICISFPADELKVVQPPIIPPVPAYPPECYDDRNEFVESETEEIKKKRKIRLSSFNSRWL